MAHHTDYTAARRRMIVDQLQRRGIRSTSVLEAMARVPRERFVGASNRTQAYLDNALPIDCDQTISQPYMVARMTEALELTGSERVLEIGVGSGYQTAVLLEMGVEVIGLERHAYLAEQARARLEALGYRRVTIRVADGHEGHSELAPYDRILIAAATADWPPALWDQLAEGGIMVAPLGDMQQQVLQSLHKRGGKRITKRLVGCRFVPLLRGVQ